MPIVCQYYMLGVHINEDIKVIINRIGRLQSRWFSLLNVFNFICKHSNWLSHICRNNWLLGVCVVKVYCLGFFSSDRENSLFSPKAREFIWFQLNGSCNCADTSAVLARVVGNFISKILTYAECVCAKLFSFLDSARKWPYIVHDARSNVEFIKSQF